MKNLTKELEVPPNGVHGISTTNSTTFVTTPPTIFDTATSLVQLELSLDGSEVESNYLDGVSAMNTFGHLLLVVPVVIIIILINLDL